MATDIFKIFQNLGLSDSETKIYLANLSLGPSSVQDIAKKARLSRTAAYDTVKSLRARGLMSTFERGKKTFFIAEQPDRVLSYFKSNVDKMANDLKTFKKVMPEMKSLAGSEKPAVRFYEGDEAVYALFAHIGRVKPDSLYEVSNIDAVHEFIDAEVLTEARKHSNPIDEVKILHTGEIVNKRNNVQFRRFPKGTLDFTGDIWIYGKNIAFVSYVGKVVTVIIENEAFADTARVLFDTAWTFAGLKK